VPDRIEVSATSAVTVTRVLKRRNEVRWGRANRPMRCYDIRVKADARLRPSRVTAIGDVRLR